MKNFRGGDRPLTFRVIYLRYDYPGYQYPALSVPFSMQPLHPLLVQQLQQHGLNLDDLPPPWRGLMTTVSETYQQSSEQSKFYADLVENMPVCLVVWQLEDLNDDRTLRLVALNSMTAQLTKVHRQSLIGKTIDEVFPDLPDRTIPQKLAEMVRSGKAMELPDVYNIFNVSAEGFYSHKPFLLPNQCVGFLFENISDSLNAQGRTYSGQVLEQGILYSDALRESEARYRKMAQRESLLYRLAKQIRNTLDLDTILETAVNEIRNFLQIDRCLFSWFRPDPNQPYWDVVKEAKTSDLPTLVGHYPLVSMTSSPEQLINRLSNYLNTRRVDDVSKIDDPIQRNFYLSLGSTALLIVAIQTSAGAIGVIHCAQCSSPRPWSDAEVELVQAVADSVAIAISSAELYEQTRTSEVRYRELAKRESLLNRLTNQIRNTLELDTILETAVNEIRNLLQVDRCHFMWLRPDPNQPYWDVVKESAIPALSPLLGQYPLSKITSSPEQTLNGMSNYLSIYRIDDVSTIDDPIERQFLLSFGYTALLGVAIQTPSGAIGAIDCGQCSSPRPWSDSEVELLQTVADSVAIAISQAELYQQTRTSETRYRKLAQQESLLNRLAKQIRNTLELDTILETAVNEILRLFQIDSCQFMWCRTDSNQPYFEIVKEAAIPDLPSSVGHYYPLSSVTSRPEQALSDISKYLDIHQIDDVSTIDDPIQRQFLLSLGYTAMLSVAIQTPSGAIGGISCINCSGPRPWSHCDVELIQAVADSLAIAISQAELYEQTRVAALNAQAQAQKLEQALYKLQETQTQLIQTEKMSSLGQMVAGVAHEINNPVSFIYGNLRPTSDYTQDLLNLLHLYQKHFPDPGSEIAARSKKIDLDFIVQDLPKILHSMKTGAERIRNIVLSLRNFSRLDESEMKPVDIHEGIDSTLLILQHRLKDTGGHPAIQVIKEYGKLPSVECHAGQLNQVFMNILGNAIDALEASENPTPTITIRTEVEGEVRRVKGEKGSPHTEPNTLHPSSVVIRIADNGSGIPKNVIKRIFDPFFTTKPVGKGTGLGLSISYQIVVERHSGVLKCQSEPGQGTEFTIEIPIDKPARD